MPFIEDWITHPMTIINRLYDKSPSTFEHDVRNYFQSHIDNPALYKEIPSLNDRHDESPLPSGCLVRYRAMVQDMADDEIYCTHYKVRSNDHHGTVIEKSAKFMDLFVCPPGYSIVVEEPPREKFGSRQCFTCVPIPNESQWVKDTYQLYFGEEMTMQKRPIHEQDNVQQLLSPLKRLKASAPMETTDGNSETVTKVEPVKTIAKSSCMVKVYDTADDMILNTMVEFIGIYYEHSVIKADSLQALNQMDPDQVPHIKTIHCIQYKKLSHINPILYHLRNIESSQILLARQYTLSLFESIFPNDKLLCEYLLLHIISRIYVRQLSVAYGKLSLNISNISAEQLSALEQLLQTILPLHSRLSITIDTLNTMQLMPNKDVAIDDSDASQLKQTPLQLPFSSHLLIDETKMECGQLTTLGLNNIKLLQDLLRLQTLKYEFHVYQLDYECDVRCLIVSSTKSILSCDVHVRYQSEQEVKDITFPNVAKEQIDNIRCYLTYVGQQLEFDKTMNNISSDINTHIQEDFVNMRKQKLLTNLDDFHHLLVLARLEALSYGENVLTENHWNQAKSLEFTRRQRMNI
ncbi:unnamed protein product [Rotaria magnacalcarata]|uniref:Mini-chromosome maintenance complex-binding protein n=1 Tax=Rotaria magnacalcarata TaxID=392030 RepID=A0A816XEE1_9BILA|nr:unnamed protein product [Rotaria magnacalcarata]CAF2166390.1 unnamed protein product [Rotaria magnacalcarata]